MNGIFENISDFFAVANDCRIPYLILRNYENIKSPSIYVEGHGDIDILADDSRKFATFIGAQSYNNKNKEQNGDGYHFYITVNGKIASLDIRSVGDGYYCKNWEIDMLSNRIENDDFFVMDKEDYFYSLIYHSILQKRSFSKEYQERLSLMGSSMGMNLTNFDKNDFIRLLEIFMKNKGYTFTYPKDIFVPLNIGLINNKKMIELDFCLGFKHWKLDLKIFLIEKLVSFKHKIFGKR